jgi:streptogramin lyase
MGEPLLDEGGQQAAVEARLANPEAVRAREESRTKFESLSASQAAQTASESFPTVIEDPAGGPPRLPAGQRIVGYLTDNAAQIELGGGQNAVVESFGPMAIESSAGARVPINLGLRDTGSGFEPDTPAVGVQIPKHLSSGVQLPGVGMSLTPVDASGAALSGAEGVIDGVTVLYANTQTDMDSLVKPTTGGFAADALLRSAASPQQLFFRLGLPAGARLVQTRDGSGAVDVVEEGAVIASVLPVSARDAAGTSVPVLMSVSGDTLALSVDARSAEYQYPIEVDPTFLEEHFTNSGSRRSNWEWNTASTSNFASKPTDNKETKELSESNPESVETYGIHEYKEGEWAYWGYQTQGVSKIYEFEGETEAKNTGDHIGSRVELIDGGVTEEKEMLSTEAEGTAEYAKRTLPEALCPKGKGSCVSTSGGAGNAVHFQQSVVGKPTSSFSFSDFLYKPEVYLSEPAGTHSSSWFNVSAKEFSIEVENEKHEKVKENRANGLYGSSNWMSEYDGALELVATDPGIGVAATRLEYENAPGKWEQLSEHNYVTENACTGGVQCYPKHEEYWTLNTRLPNGEDKIRYRAEDAMGEAKHETESLETEKESTKTIKVDHAKPYGIFTGGLPYGNELSAKKYELTTYATDGEGSTTPSSGIPGIEGTQKGMKLFVDGYEAKEVGTQTGCTAAKGECTASAKWTIEGAELSAGFHAIVIVVKDRAGNEEREEETLSIRHSTPVPIGPGSVDLQTGDFALGASDVSLGSGLSVSRVYSSRDLTVGAEGTLGPQWALSVGGEDTLVEMPDYSVLVTSATGGQTIFAAVLNSERKPTGKFEAPPGDSNLTMTLEENAKKEPTAYYLKDPAAGTSTTFMPSSTPKVWLPAAEKGPVATDTVSYIYQTVEVEGKKVTRPLEERAATPGSVSCEPPEPGCRLLKFTYATKTATGEKESEWNEYLGRLSKVSYVGYNPATKKMTETPIAVAEYSYDSKGRLRAEWDPRISPALKIIYGYDTEGHVTALTQPGQESWAFTYGVTATDAGTGRLLKATQAPTALGLWNGEAPQVTTAPTLSGSTVIGSMMGVSSGTWKNSPVAYTYQWEDCNAEGKECKLLTGEITANHTVTKSDIGHKLVAVVTATNGGGSVSTSVSTALIQIAENEYASGSRPYDIVAGPEKDLWVTDYGSSKIIKMTTSGTIAAEYALPKESGPEGITTGPEETLWFTDYLTNKIGKMTKSGTIVAEYELAHESKPVSITEGPEENLWFTEYGTSKIGKITPSGTITQYELKTSSDRFPNAITLGPDKNLWFTDFNAHSRTSIGKITPSGTITEYETTEEGYSESYSRGITSGPDGNLWYTNERSNRISKITTSGVITEYALPSGSSPEGIVQGGGKLWYTDHASGKIGEITTSGAVSEYALPTESSPVGIAQGSDKNLWFAEYGTNKVGKINLNPTEGTHYSAGPGWTMDYNVPVSGSGAPHNMSQGEVAKWGQKSEETPSEATAIFPPDSPQNWPAASYTRASLYYLDEEGRVVNVARPSTGTYGSISTSEYNEHNDVVRTLSPDNRVTALEAGESKSAEVASLLSTVSQYNEPKCRKESAEPEKEAAEPGTRLCETWGPQHEVRYTPNGFHEVREALARNYTKYYYEDLANGAPELVEGKPQAYDLVTETSELALLANGEQVEVRDAKTSYSGQSNLGWKLRAPTSVTVATESEGAKITHTTLYNENGQITEARGPKGSEGNSPHDAKTVYYSQEENKEYKECGKHPEWAGLVCESLPGKQPETAGLPSLPITTTTYNIWDEPEEIKETFSKTGSFPETTRTKKEGYDAAGRMTSSEETSTASTESTDKTLPPVTMTYSSSTGTLENQSTKVGEVTKTITSKFNTLGQMETYTDADGNVTKYKYGTPEKDGLLESTIDGSGTGTTLDFYIYDATTKLPKEQSYVGGAIKATYDVEGQITSEVYPNGICANYTRNSVGEATHIEYLKTSNCSEKEPGVWFSESKVPSVRGETSSRTSTLAKEEYAYDTIGRLTGVQETPAGEYCKTRSYVYDEESNRTELTAREPNSKKECATEGGTTEKHTYDEADRLTDSGIVYDPLGNVLKLPSADAEGHALESTFYVDNAVATQTQNGVTNNYYVDPNGRVRETVTGGKKVISHYDGSSEAVAWTSEGSGETAKWTREIPGIDGSVSEIDKGEGTTSELPVIQLHDLQGDVVATIKDKTGETELLSKYNSTEFGVPNGGKEPPKLAWLGATGAEDSLSSGVITEGATSYVPQTGMALQDEQVAPPGLPDGSGAGAPYVFQESPWNTQGAERVGAEEPGLEAGREKTAAEAACKAAPLTCAVFEDPPPHVYHLTEIESYKLADAIMQLEQSNEESGYGSPWIDPSGSLEGALLEFFGPGEVGDWDASLAKGLVTCLKWLGKHESEEEGEPGCRDEETTQSARICVWGICTPSVTVIDVRKHPIISACNKGYYSGSKHVYSLRRCTRVQ